MPLNRIEDKQWLSWAIQRLPNSHRMIMQFHLKEQASPGFICRFCRIDEATLSHRIDEGLAMLEGLQETEPPANPIQVPAKGFRYLIGTGTQVGGHSEPQPCLACGFEVPGFVVKVLDDNVNWDHRYVCDPCLRGFKLESLGVPCNEADVTAVLSQLEKVRPDLPADERRALASQRTREVQFGTPRPLVWQPFQWPAHCGDYFGFYGQVQRDDLNEIAPGGDGRTFFLTHLETSTSREKDWGALIWDHGDFAPSGFNNVYLWRCLHCDQPLLTSDHD